MTTVRIHSSAAIIVLLNISLLWRSLLVRVKGGRGNFEDFDIPQSKLTNNTRMGSRLRALVVGIYLHFLTLFLPGYKVGRFRQTPMVPVEFIYDPLECWISLSFRRSI